jgi:RNA polymerase sigma-70 factor (ECF subfamily)
MLHGYSLNNDTENIADAGETGIDRLSYEEIVEAIRQLSPVYKTVFNLFVIEGLTHEEIAAQLEISVGASKSNLSKARNNLRKIISNQTQYKAYASS